MYNNSFGHLDVINVQGEGRTCRFAGNSITQWSDSCFSALASACTFQDNIFMKGCTCSFEWLDKLSPGRADLRKTSYCQIDNLMHCFNTSTFNAFKFHEMLCGESPILDCKKTMAEKKVEANFVDPNDFTLAKLKYERYLYLAAGSICVIVLIAIMFLVLRVKCRTKQCTGHSSSLNRSHVEMNRTTTLPGGSAATKTVRTFSAHDTAIVDLALEKLRVKHPREVFDQVDTYTRKLMSENLSETEKVLTIGEIVRLLDECENIGDDFLAFTDLLYRHLDETNSHAMQDERHPSSAAGDPLYAEPGMMGVLPGTTIIATNLESENHIYAEPNSAQQPLLKTEYSLPMDRSGEPATCVYADPVGAQKGKTIIKNPFSISG